jgi:hypothetical protein
VNGEGSQIATKWLARHELAAANLLIPSGGMTDLAQRWGVTAVPLTILVGTNGAIQQAELGILSSEAFAAIQRAL